MHSSSLFQSSSAFKNIQEALDTVTSYFSDLLRLKSPDLYAHSVRVSNYAGATAIYMRLPANEITLIRYAAFLHKIGYLALPNQILNKAPYLSRRELSLYKKYPELGANMLESCPGCQDLLPYIRSHHERWDGTGYPKHLKNVNIPLGARIIAVASYFDSNIYSSADFKQKTKAEVSQMIFSSSGILFDPEVITAFLKVIFHSCDISVK
ncbi:HD-GYP domain-containing protein [Dialister micraerophilus]|uniref:HD-GYP domain-containing protein n=1 Tax=Dialister micraerophilus TaxID=309120 RepID=UPI00254B29DD|nr:HD domain-containing phosphohydrolase [Dialister micraerophilus]MDK8285701.1 HD domain-containing phosphohydrolase [Dialister micraerophilus]